MRWHYHDGNGHGSAAYPVLTSLATVSGLGEASLEVCWGCGDIDRDARLRKLRRAERVAQIRYARQAGGRHAAVVDYRLRLERRAGGRPLIPGQPEVEAALLKQVGPERLRFALRVYREELASLGWKV